MIGLHKGEKSRIKWRMFDFIRLWWTRKNTLLLKTNKLTKKGEKKGEKSGQK